MIEESNDQIIYMLRSTKADLVDSMYNQVGLSKSKSAQVIESRLEIIKNTLENGEDVLISRFGRFCLKEKRGRRRRNPQTGEELMRALWPSKKGDFFARKGVFSLDLPFNG
jgi:integration host factor subunit alpha